MGKFIFALIVIILTVAFTVGLANGYMHDDTKKDEDQGS